MPTIAVRLALALLLLAPAGCAPRARQGGAAPGEQPPTTIRVDNRGFNDVTIYVVRSSQRIRLGNVTGLSSQTLTIPKSLIFGSTPLRFIADPIGGRAAPVTQEIAVQPGDEVELLIPH
jgi:hypothetical protein